nr:MAG: polymerase [Bole Tick Virus 3]
MGSQRLVPFSPSDLVFERKFDVALRKSHGESFFRRYDADELSRDDKLLLAAVSLHKRSFAPIDRWKINVNIFPDLLVSLLDARIPDRSGPLLTKVSRIAGRLTEIQIGWAYRNSEPSLRPSGVQYSKTVMRALSQSEMIQCLFHFKQELDLLVAGLPRASERRNQGESPEDHLNRLAQNCYWECKWLDVRVCWAQYSCVVWHNHTTYYLPRQYLLLIHNKVCDILSVLVYSSACPIEVYGTRLLSVTERFLRIWMMMAQRYDQKFFHISKVLEGLCIGETLVEIEGSGNAEFLDTIADGLLTDVGFCYHGSQLQLLFQEVSIPVRHELACLSKVMGHPFCDVERGAIALEAKVNAEKLIDLDAVLQCVRYAKLDFIRKFLMREKTWPLIEMDVDAPRTLKMACLLNHDPKSPAHQHKYGNFRVEMMDFITILPNMKFDWLENFIPYIKDKTITLGKSAVVARYINKMQADGADWKQTRLLLYYLLQPETKTDHLWYLSAYIGGDWEQVANYLVIRIVPKEKEHKVEPRGFGCKTYEDRARGIVQEENVAMFLDRYSDEHVMTLNEVRVAKKLLGFRNLGAAYSGYGVLLMSVDSKSWNNQFRSATVAPVAGAVLDRVFGVDLFSKTHTAYEKATVYVPDADRVIYWSGQDGGVEGLNQDTWVFVYIHQIKVCMEGLPYPYFILCKGDDLRIAMMIPPEVLKTTSLDKIKRDSISHIAERGAAFGHVIKVEDSYVSENYFAYSKDAYVAGVEQPQSFRKVQKCYGANNAFLTTLDDYIASAFSNAHSTAKACPSPIPCYYVASWWSFESILKHPRYMKEAEESLVALMMIPNMLGGFPIIFLHNFFVRAESDLLPPFLDLLAFCKEYYPVVGKFLDNAMHQRLASPESCLVGLMVDPYSLPIVKPRPASTVLRRAVTDMVRKKTRNMEVKELFDIAHEGFELEFVDAMASANVYNAKLMSALYQCTPEGVVRTLIRKFETGRSIYDALVLQSGPSYAHRVLRQCMRADVQLHRYRINLIRGRLSKTVGLLDDYSVGTECPYRIAADLRRVTWGKPVEGITQPPLQHQISVGTIGYFGTSDVAAYNHFEVLFEPPPSPEAPLFTKGAYQPFVGETTGKGLAPPEANIESHNMISTNVRTLLDLIQWLPMTGEYRGQLVTSNLTRIAEHLLQAYTETDIRQLSPFYSRALSHRMTQHHVRVNNFRASIVPNTLLNLYTRASGTYNAHVTIKLSVDKYRINYLHVYTHIVSMWAGLLWTGQPSKKRVDRLWGVTAPECPCMEPMTETPMVLARTSLPPVMLTQVTRLGEAAVREISEEVAKFDPSQYYVADDAEDHISLEEAQMALIQSHVNSIWAQRVQLRNLYTSHHLTERGAAALSQFAGINTTPMQELVDLHHVPPDLIVRDVAFMVFTEILKRFKVFQIRSMSTYLGMIPGEELPWTSFLQSMDECGLFYSLQQTMHKLVPTLYDTIQDRPRSASALFGAACYELVINGMTSPRIAYLSYGKNPSVSSDILYRIRGARLYAVRQRYNPLFRTMDSLTPRLRADILATYAAGLTCVDDITFDLESFTPDHLRQTVPLFEFSEDFEDDFPSQVAINEDTHLPEWQWTKYAEMGAGMYGLSNSDICALLEDLCMSGDLEYRRSQFLDEMLNPTVEIYRTDLVACANRVREEQTGSFHLGPTAAVVSESTMPTIDARKHRSLYIAPFDIHEASNTPPTGYTWSIEPDPEFKGTIFNRRWTLRPIGSGNISMSKAYTVLCSIGLPVLPDNINCACLGDGYGGYSAVVCSITKGSRILFNTKPNRQGGTAMPVYALEVAELQQNQVEYSDIELGHYDLAEPTTYRVFEKHTKALNLITMDAEILPRLCQVRHDMLHYVCRFFVRNGLPGSVLILKVYSDEAPIWLGIVGWLRPRCRYMCVLRCDASALDGEFFIISQLDKPEDVAYDSAPKWPPSTTTHKIHNFCHIRYNAAIHDDEGGCNDLGLSPAYPTHWLDIATKLPLYGWSKLQEVTRVVMPLPCKFRKDQAVSEWAGFIRQVLRGVIFDVRDELDGVLQKDAEKFAYDTLTHVLHIVHRLATIEGFLLIVTLVQRGEISVTAKHCNDGYRAFIHSIAQRIDLRSNIAEHPQGAFEYKGETIHPFKHWKVGMRWGVQAMTISKRL